MLRFYIEVARTAFRRQLIYRWANLAGLLTNAFFGIVSSSVLIALFQARHSAGGYDMRESLRYLWLAQSLVMVVLPFNWSDLMLTIRSGEVVSDLSKPCDFCWYWFSRELGRDIRYYTTRACRACPLKAQCTRNKESRRITRWVDEHLLEEMAQRVAARPDIMRQRKRIVEHPFGVMKHALGHAYFLMRRLTKVRTEMSLTVLAFNLRRVLNIVGVPRLLTAVA